MKTTKKALLFTFCAVLLVVASVLGTMAYLTSSYTVTNTFTVGKVQIKLDEAIVDSETGKAKTGNDAGRTDEEQSYKLVPGRVIDKDPTITVISDSEKSYIRMLLTVTYDNDADEVLAKADYPSWFDFNITNWSAGNIIKTTKTDKTTTRVYEFRYNDTFDKVTSDTKVAPLFTTITVPGTLTNEDIGKLKNLKIVAEAHAIQAEGFADADDAWSKFKTN